MPWFMWVSLGLVVSLVYQVVCAIVKARRREYRARVYDDHANPNKPRPLHPVEYVGEPKRKWTRRIFPGGN